MPGVAPWIEFTAAAPPAPLAIARVLYVVAAEFGITVEQMRGDYRSTPFVRARHVGMYLAQRVTLRSLPAIGRVFRKDHTTVLNAIRKMARRLEANEGLRERVQKLENRLRGAVE